MVVSAGYETTLGNLIANPQLRHQLFHEGDKPVVPGEAGLFILYTVICRGGAPYPLYHSRGLSYLPRWKPVTYGEVERQLTDLAFSPEDIRAGWVEARAFMDEVAGICGRLARTGGE